MKSYLCKNVFKMKIVNKLCFEKIKRKNASKGKKSLKYIPTYIPAKISRIFANSQVPI